MSLKDKVEGNELDLSLNQLTDVPVKELAATPKATHLDLSCNLIQILPNDFATLTHLIKIDLSRNKLTELPHNFGNLINLQSLDLDRNELKTVPLSFCRLKNLRWLDLKDNPLEPKLKAVAGDCLDEKQCQACAKKVVTYMQSIESNLEREKQKKLKEVREKEAVEKAKMERELEEQRRLKKVEKERRKAESRARNEEMMKQNKENIEKDKGKGETEKEVTAKFEERKSSNWYMWLLPFLLIIVAVAIYFIIAEDVSVQNISMSDVKAFTAKYGSILKKDIVKFWNSKFIPFAMNFKSTFLRHVHSIMISVSNFGSNLETFLSIYF